MVEATDRVAQVAGRSRRNPERVREDILEAATIEFARRGLPGARVAEIADRTQTAKRMIYYYFGDKEGLYTAVLERSYLRLRDAERLAAADGVDPIEDLRQMAEATFDYHNENRDHVRLVAGENLLEAQYLRGSDLVGELGQPGLNVLTDIVERGRDAGLFRPEVEAFHLHILINSFTLFRVANRHTIEVLFRHDMLAVDEEASARQFLVDTVLRAALTDPSKLSYPRTDEL